MRIDNRLKSAAIEKEIAYRTKEYRITYGITQKELADKAIDFLSGDNNLVQWTSRGNSSPDNCYRNGMIEDSPFNVDATDFIGIFGE